uniref:Knottin scorpion toxin-like domain-containing protein n=1 Tax=Aegilops tauschii subsp. strangulata TaxID=200361 RepID=A0A453Q9Q4_AEGTS
MALLSKDSTVMFLAALVVMAMAMIVLSSSYAQADYCHQIVPCNESTCSNFCLKNNFKNFVPNCLPGRMYDYCCCNITRGLDF